MERVSGHFRRVSNRHVLVNAFFYRTETTAVFTKFPFDKVLIANRGEIAVRIARACNDLGLKTAGIYAKEDAGSLHVQKVDEAFRITSKNAGPIAPYLDTESVIAAAKKCGAGALHPGYGFFE